MFDKAITSMRTSGDITSEILPLYICIKDQYLVHIFFFFFFLRILSIFNTHKHGEREEDFFKETYSSVYPKGPNNSPYLFALMNDELTKSITNPD